MGRGRHAILSRSLADLFRNISFAILRSDSAPDRAAQFRLRVRSRHHPDASRCPPVDPKRTLPLHSKLSVRQHQRLAYLAYARANIVQDPR
jgi:hypothetical protein